MIRSSRLRHRLSTVGEGLKTLDAAAGPLRLGPRTTQTASTFRLDACSGEPCHA